MLLPNISSEYLSIVITGLVGALLGVSIIANLLLLRRTVGLKQENDRLGKDVSEKLDDLIFEMTKKSLSEIKAAGIGASEIIRKTEFLSNETKNQFLTDIQVISEAQKKAFQETLQQSEKEMIAHFATLNASAETEIKKRIAQYQEVLTSSTVEVKSTAEKNALRYQEALIKELNNEFYNQFLRLTREVLKTSITPVDHEALLLKALSEAKQKNVF